MKTENKSLIITAGVLILLAAIARLLPHPPNFAPIAALGIFGGSVIGDKKYAFVLPLFALFLSDLLFQLFTTTPGFYGVGQIFVYAAFMLITFLATKIKVGNTKNILFACVWSGVLFFVISNFGVWASSNFYPKTWSGLTSCFAAAIPFYRNEFFGNLLLNTFMSNIFFTCILFGAYSLIRKTVLANNTQMA